MLLLLFAALAAAGIAVWLFQGERGAPQSVPRTAETITQPLEGTEWVWRGSAHAGGEMVAPSGEQFVLVLGRDGTVTSTTDCNGMGGTYLRDGEVLSFGSFISTKMYCEGSLESVYAGDLALTSSHTIEDDRLTLILNRDMGTMHFTARE